MTAEAYPLQWPAGWPRTPQHQQGRSRFTTGYKKAIRRLKDELRLLGATDLVISSDVPVRRDGMLYADAARRKIDNPGVAIYFRLKGKPMVMARDVYWTPHENITGLAHAIEHMRGLARHGGDFMMYQAFEGFTALPAPAKGPSCWDLLGVSPNASPAEIDRAFRDAAKKAHPDAGGSDAAMATLSAAKQEAMQVYA